MQGNESRQMEMLFQEGGIADDGTTVDPVSGNEVPPGSMAEEVRDDVPAQLSEGEYVVPADVVRFYGVRFFEDLRGQAKQGLMDMERNGRIGGEPVAQTMDNQTDGELTPEELAELEQIVGMAMGGMVQQPNQSPDPYQQQQQQYQQPAPVAMGNAGYNEGGLEDGDSGIDPYDPQFTSQTAAAFSPGFLIDATRGTTSDIKTVILYGPGGEVETLTLPVQQDRYDELVAMGYSETQVDTSADTSVGQTSSDSDDSNSSPFFGVEEDLSNPSFDVSSIDVKDLSSTAGRLDTLHKGTLALSGIIPGVATGAMLTGVSARFNDVIDRMDEEGIEHDFDRKSNVFGGEGSLYEGLKDKDKNGVGFGDTWLGDMLGFDGKLGIEDRPGLKESRQGARRDTSTSSGSSSSSNNSSSNNSSNANQSAADEAMGGRSSSSSSSSSASEARASAQRAADRLGTSLATGGR